MVKKTAISNQKLIDTLISSRKTRLNAFRTIEPSRQGFILLALSPTIQKDILTQLDNEEILNFLNPLDPEKATDILQVLPEARSKKITQALNESIKYKVEFLLKFNPKAAAGLMNLDYLVIQKGTKLKDIIVELTKYEAKTNTFPTILVVENGKLLGEILGSTLVLRKEHDLSDHHIKRIPSIRYDSDVNRVINSFIKNPRSKVVVLDEFGNALGIIHSNEILRLMDKHAVRDLYGFAGVNKEESTLDSSFTKVRFRWKWLILNLGTAFLAASVVGLFEDTISRFTFLAIYMPIVAGMGGNAGTQALAVTVRGLVLKEVQLRTSARLIYNEVIAGAMNGLINGAIIAFIAIVINQNPILGLLLAITMIINLVVAGFFGAFVPLFMKAIGKDPASSATIFITTATDVVGFFVFLGLASILL